MKLLIAILVLVVFAVSFWADHKWRQWMKTRDQSHSNQLPDDPTRRS
jgi:hypothetical protein